MTENWAQILNAGVGCVVTWGTVFLLNAIGAADRFQLVAGMLGIVFFSFLVGVITGHYHDKAIAEGKDPDDRFK
jgi:high-affinity Fe2+/Pb2+ permease